MAKANMWDWKAPQYVITVFQKSQGLMLNDNVRKDLKREGQLLIRINTTQLPLLDKEMMHHYVLESQMKIMAKVPYKFDKLIIRGLDFVSIK